MLKIEQKKLTSNTLINKLLLSDKKRITRVHSIDVA